MTTKKSLLSASALGMSLFFSAFAHSELYVSPVTSGSASYHQGNQITKTNTGRQLLGQQSYQGAFSESPVSTGNVLKYGKDVPLYVAVENLVPVKDGWAINLDDNLQEMTVSWEGGETWHEILKNIGRQNGLKVVISGREKAVGISTQENVARHLASRVPQVWRVSKEKSLKQNLESWASEAGWSLHWDETVKIDYPIHHNAVITGVFEGDGGAVDQFLSALQGLPEPLSAIFYQSNRVVRVVHAGFRQANR